MINKDRVWGSAKYWIGIIGLAIIYHLGARLGLLMAHVQPNTSPVWPPTGIALAALLILGLRYWPGVALGVMLGFLVNNNPSVCFHWPDHRQYPGSRGGCLPVKALCQVS